MLPLKKKEDDSEKKELDWGEVYTELLCHTSMNYDQIGERTIPQIRAIRLNLPMQVAAKSQNFLFGATGETKNEPEPDREHTVEESMAIAAMFSNFG